MFLNTWTLTMLHCTMGKELYHMIQERMSPEAYMIRTNKSKSGPKWNLPQWRFFCDEQQYYWNVPRHNRSDRKCLQSSSSIKRLSSHRCRVNTQNWTALGRSWMTLTLIFLNSALSKTQVCKKTFSKFDQKFWRKKLLKSEKMAKFYFNRASP